jgi:TPR repeat protein
MYKLLLTLLIMLLFSASTAWAGDIEDADAALKRKDYATALIKYKSAAVNNDVYAQAMVGSYYANDGYGVKKDFVESMYWYKMAAEKGMASAQYAVGVMYAEGDGVVKDVNEALRWYQLGMVCTTPAKSRVDA